jgi:hypothetical protein
MTELERKAKGGMNGGCEGRGPQPRDDLEDGEVAEEEEEDQVRLLMYDGSTVSRHADDDAMDGQDGKGKKHGRRSAKADRSTMQDHRVPASKQSIVEEEEQEEYKEKGGGEEREEVMDLGLLVGRAAVLERILNAGKRVRLSSLSFRAPPSILWASS